MSTTSMSTTSVSAAETAAAARPRAFRRLHRGGPVLVASVLLALTAACGSSTPEAGGSAPSSASSAKPAGGAYPVTISNCDRTLTFDHAPKRVVSLAQPQTDVVVDLGLVDRVVGQAQLGVVDGLAGSAEPEGSENIPVIAKSGVPAKEVTVSQSPDLVLAPTTYEFDGEQGFATMKDLEAADIAPYLAAGGCPERRIHRSVKDTLVDLDSLGQIFGVQDRAKELASDYTGQLDEVADALQGTKPVKVAEVYIWGSDIQSLVGSTENDLVRAAGGVNVFAPGDPQFKGMLFANLSAEVVAATQPEAFVFSAGSEKEADQVRATLRKTFPSTPAVRNDKLIAYSSSASLPGSMTTPAAVRYVAEQLHPDAF